jgi:uncharacterized protein Yka (UPF0111/DUF47 family)
MERNCTAARRSRESFVIQTMLKSPSYKLFNLQGGVIVALREALNAVSVMHDEMLALIQEVNDLEDEIDNGPAA